jgi:hypothetical protein
MSAISVATNTSQATDTDAPAGPAPVVVDLGKRRRKQIRQLTKGGGKLLDEVIGTVEELRAAGTIAADAQAVVFVVRQRRRRLKSLIPRL